MTACGQSAAASGDPDRVVVSWTSSGPRRWKARYDRADLADWACEICLDSKRNAYVAGAEERAQEEPVAVTAKYSRSGKLPSRRSYAGAESLGATLHIMARRPGGSVYVRGYSQDSANPSGYGRGPLVFAYTSAGSRTVFVEDPELVGVGGVDAVDVAAGGTVITGGSQWDAADVDCPEVRSFSPAGEVLSRWSWESGISRGGNIQDVAHDAAGNIYWAGHLTAQNTVTRIPLIGRRSLSGAGGDCNGAWSGVSPDSAVPLACAASGSGLVVVPYREAGGVFDMFVLKYQP